MTVRKIRRAGHPDLRSASEPYSIEELENQEIDRLVHDMFETMENYEGVGLAAPQVQVNRRLVVYEIRDTERYEGLEEKVPPTVLVNPEIQETGGESRVDWEGCLSLPNLRGQVPRSNSIKVEYLDLSGDRMTKQISGFEARVIQHEIDHLEGRLFVDRMESHESLSFLKEYRKYHAE